MRIFGLLLRRKYDADLGQVARETTWELRRAHYKCARGPLAKKGYRDG